MMKILAVSDIVVELIYSQRIKQLFPEIDVVISCGDLPQNYLEYIESMLDTPLFYVRGNHSPVDTELEQENMHKADTFDLHCRLRRYGGYTFAGVEGSLRYSNQKYQYSQFDMWLKVFQIIPPVLINRLKTGRFLDVFVSHAPPWGIHDQEDHAHQGIKSFRWFISIFQPAYHLHGHIHVYRPDTATETLYKKTKVVNAFGHRRITIEMLH
jgi:uncharacterized protein